MARTKIVATLGPSCDDRETMTEMVRAGVDVFRINTSHAGEEEVRRLSAMVREIEDELDRTIGTLVDLQGPKIRLTAMESVEIDEGDELSFRFTDEDRPGQCDFAISGERLANDLEVGDDLLLSDGEISITVTENPAEAEFRGEVNFGDRIEAKKGVSIRGKSWSVQSLTERDMEMLDVALDVEADFIGVSFVRNAKDILKARRPISNSGKRTHIVAKIELAAGVANFEEILAATDAVMIARGDLGVEMPLEEIPVYQKRIAKLTNRSAKPVITATQMLDSMIDTEVPTRAEVSDVANAILDGSDAVMLSNETSVGENPVTSVETMERIANTVDRDMMEYQPGLHTQEQLNAIYPVPESMCRSAVNSAHLLDAAAIIVPTASGFSARMISRMRPTLPVFAPSPNIETARQLNLSAGIHPIHSGVRFDPAGELIDQLKQIIPEQFFEPGNHLVFVGAMPYGGKGKTNFVKVEVV